MSHFGKPDARRLAVVRCGPIAHEVLSEDVDLFVLAVFERSFYLGCPRGLVCVGTGIGAGPINVELASAPRDWAALGIAPDVEGRIEHGIPYVTERLALDLDASAIWAPSPLPPFTPQTVASAIARLSALASPDLPDDGLARLVFEGHAGNVEAQMAQASIGDLRTGLVSALADVSLPETLARAATLLVGLGPGLTPSGDDLLGGVLLALSATRNEALRDALWDVLVPELDALTVPISAMHLSAAADGLAGEALHALVCATLADAPSLHSALRQAVSLGHTSGWDTLAGLVLGLDAVLAADRKDR